VLLLRHAPWAGRGLQRLALGALALVAAGLVLGWALVHLVPPAYELAALREFADRRTDGGVTLMRAVSTALSLEVSLVFGLGLLALLRWRSGGWAAPTLLALTFVGSFAITGAIKVIVARERPLDALVGAYSASFPSGHTSRAAALAALGIWALPVLLRHPAVRAGLSALLLGGVLLVGLSRVYLGIHFPSDVAFATILGFSWVGVLVTAVRPEVAPRPGTPPPG
jgi:undecaprenyl-diphosphatase